MSIEPTGFGLEARPVRDHPRAQRQRRTVYPVPQATWVCLSRWLGKPPARPRPWSGGTTGNASTGYRTPGASCHSTRNSIMQRLASPSSCASCCPCVSIIMNGTNRHATVKRPQRQGSARRQPDIPDIPPDPCRGVEVGAISSLAESSISSSSMTLMPACRSWWLRSAA